MLPRLTRIWFASPQNPAPVIWNVVVADNKMGYAITGPPLAIDGKILIGTGGSEAAVRGLLDRFTPRPASVCGAFVE